MMLPIAQMTLPASSGQLPPLPEGPSLDRLRLPPGAESALGWWATVLLLGLLATIALLLIYLRKQSRKTPPPPSPYRAALAEIETARGLAVSDRDFAGLCSGAIRRLLLQHFNLEQSGLTHEELTYKIPLEKEEKQQIRDFFNLCDGVKFAQVKLSKEERIALSDTALKIANAFKSSQEEVRA